MLLEAYYNKQSEPQKSCLLALRHIILQQDPLVQETRKWNMPCFCYKKRPFCYLWIDKNTQEPYVLFVEGRLLDFPDLVQGKRAKMKTFLVDSNADLPIDRLDLILKAALDLYRNGFIKVKD